MTTLEILLILLIAGIGGLILGGIAGGEIWLALSGAVLYVALAWCVERMNDGHEEM